MFKKNKKKTPFEEYYKIKLEKDNLTPLEFSEMIASYFLGHNYYIVDSMSDDQIRRLMLNDIMKCYPQSRSRIKSDKIWLDRIKNICLQSERLKEENIEK